jgi:DNA-binding NtrC family response regulator
VLLVDDNAAVVESLLPLLKELPSECTVATTWNETVDVVLKAAKDNAPFDLAIFDLWVPFNKDGPVDKGGGLMFLLENVYFQILPYGTPLIVFTGHESYETCVRCIKAGAIDYLPKVIEEGNAVEKLLALCRRVLFPEFKEDDRTAWVRDHAGQLRAKFAGKFVGLIAESVGRKAGLKQEPLDGYMLLEAASKREIGERMVQDPILRWEKPYIVDLASP